MGKYTRLFIAEARQYLRAIGTAVGAERRGEGEAASLVEARRIAHSIKGMALFEEQKAVADLSYALERGLARAAEGEGTAPLLEEIASGVKLLSTLIDEVEGGEDVTTDPSPLVDRITGMLGE